tara:strand:- start:149 stop:400 length:252 start_codon:yes stop_codon:yes gene_type:complete
MKKKCCGKYALKGERATESALDKQVGGSHYKDFKIQPIEFITANNLTFIQASIIKYICRYDKKNGKEDINKIIHYCELLKELE